jgi:hypothetical protein
MLGFSSKCFNVSTIITRMEDEIWKDLDGYPDYQISCRGKIRSLKWNKTRILKTRILKCQFDDRYMKIQLMKDGKKTIERVHRLVAQTFIPNPNNLLYVDHINRISTDNRVENLRWVSAMESSLNTSRHFTEIYGISLQRRTGYYHVEVRIDNKNKYVGRRKTIEEAIEFRNTYLVE